MTRSIENARRRRRAYGFHRVMAGALLVLSMTACKHDLLDPVDPAPAPVGGVKPPAQDTSGNKGGTGGTGGTAGTVHRNDVTFDGDVQENGGNVTVHGGVHVTLADRRVDFLDADMQMTFDDDGALRHVSGKAHIPSPTSRISFADPVEAEIGMYSGRELNANGIAGIRLMDDTDYFVYRVKTAFEMRIATGETGANATRPIAIRAPLGGEILMVVDYNDPMYYVYGSQDLLGALGFGWSLHHRIPFVPDHPVLDLGGFNGGTTRTGTFPVFKIVSITGQMVENEDTEVHLSLEDPFDSSLRMDYQMGFNGKAELDLFLKDIVGFNLPLAEASGGVWREISTANLFRGHAYLNGLTTQDFSWWPAFIPAKPIARLSTRAAIKSTGDFDVALAGTYGWDLPTGRSTMEGEFELTPAALTLKGTVVAGSDKESVAGTVTKDSTVVAIVPPASLLAGIHEDVLKEVDDRIAAGQKALDDLQKATSDYTIELSLRGLRSSLPSIVQTARKALDDGIASELSKYKGKIYYSELKSQVNSNAKPYYAALDRLETAAKEIKDNNATRKEIEAALRGLAANKIFSMTFTYKVLGKTVATVKVSERILSDANAAKLTTAADNVKYIKETSDRKIRMQQIYDAAPSKEIWARVRQDIDTGAKRIPTLNAFGFVLHHGGSHAFSLYAVLAGKRYELGSVNPFDPAAVGNAVSVTVVPGLSN